MRICSVHGNVECGEALGQVIGQATRNRHLPCDRRGQRLSLIRDDPCEEILRLPALLSALGKGNSPDLESRTITRVDGHEFGAESLFFFAVGVEGDTRLSAANGDKVSRVRARIGVGDDLGIEGAQEGHRFGD